MSNNDDNKYSFWGYLTKFNLEIPILQRDYAQGRKGKESLRKNFLTNLKEALDGKLPNGEKVLKLDFVYGSDENDRLQPLDGQQRLTTLWLLHWYVALMSGKLSDATTSTLKKFSYETRLSSREFCANLTTASNFSDYKEEGHVCDFITTRTWFRAAWKMDPTIQSMLRMLSGTTITDKGGEDIVDGIEELFQGTSKKQYEEYWAKLISTNDCPIVFYHLELNNFGLTDDLYIKMNARGKSLTQFENIKADLIGYMKDKERDDDAWSELLDLRTGIPICFDTKWMNLFWNKRSKDNKVDDIYYAFVNRFFWNELFTAKDANGKYLLSVGSGKTKEGEDTSTIENTNASYNHLNADIAPYVGLDPYKYANGEIPFSTFNDMLTILNRYADYAEKYNIPGAGWQAKEFPFIPEYEYKDDAAKISTLTQPERVVFFAVCKYFKEGSGDAVSLSRWMRVVWNLVSGDGEDGNLYLRTVGGIRNAIEILSQFKSHDIYNSMLTTSLSSQNSNVFNGIWQEECEKARQIWDASTQRLKTYPAGSLSYQTWEDAIKAAEKYAFFRGAISFLYTDAQGQTNWGDFETKFSCANNYFKNKKDADQCLASPYNNLSLLKALISRFSTQGHWNAIWLKHKTFNNKWNTWKYYLLSKNICEPVHDILMGNSSISNTATNNLPSDSRYKLALTRLLEAFIGKGITNAWLRDPYGRMGLYKPYALSEGVCFNYQQRDNFLLKNTPAVTCLARVSGTDLFWGIDVNFDYADHHFQWYRDGMVYLMEDTDEDAYAVRNIARKKEEDKYFCFQTSTKSGQLNDSEIMSNLDRLIAENGR